MLTQIEAENKVLEFMPKGTVIRSAIRHENEYLFLAISPSSLEGEYDPFIKVNAVTGDIWDYSPQDYRNPLEIINALNKADRRF